MKLLDIMKKYDRCLVRESAKLTKIYNMILKESALTDEIDEEKCPECGNDPCTCESEKENTEDIIAEEDFFEAAKADCEDEEACDECGLIPEEDFIKDEGLGENDMLRNRPHNGHIDDPAGIMSEEDFFAEAEEDKLSTQDSSEKSKKTKSDDTELMSAEEFFAEAEKSEANDFEDTSKTDEAEKQEKTDKKLDEGELSFIPAEDWIQQMKEKNLEESLKSYRRKNHHLFNG